MGHVHEVAIVGAGFGGLGMAIQLKRAAIHDFVVLERGADVGGTWWANSYPGCQCDIPSNLYSFSFAPKHDWARAYPLRDQLLDYLRGCARRFGVLPHTRLGTELLRATWVAGERHWELETSGEPLRARVLVAAPGLLSEPWTPSLPGLDGFEGAAFHTANWDHSHDLTGKRVALVGAGATATQVAPAIQSSVARLHVFQRTPPWVLPHSDHPIRPRIRALYRRLPALQRASRAWVYLSREGAVPGLTRSARGPRLLELLARVQLHRQVRDPELRRRLTPDYSIGCKRFVLSDDWYPAIQEPNVEIVSSGVHELRPRAVVGADGVERAIDTLILATGFKPAELPIAARIHGRDGCSLAQVWRGSPQAYLATAVSGFPNLFLLYGPNSNLGHNSIVFMLESQIRYTVDALRTMRRDGAAAVEVLPDVQQAYNREIQERLAASVWNGGGCGSWYLDRNGRNSIQWPGHTFEFRRRTRRFDAGSYTLTPSTPEGARVAA